jgi:hypothetical protein
MRRRVRDAWTAVSARLALGAENASSALLPSAAASASSGGEGCNRGEPLLASDMKAFSYDSLALIVRQINLAPTGSEPEGTPDGARSNQRGQQTPRLRLTPELTRRVLGFLAVRAARHCDVTVAGCSSHDGRHPLASCLSPDETTWWISAPRTMNRGRGREHVDFLLCPGESESARRLSSVSIRIPPLPRGPLSVRDLELRLRIERRGDDGTPFYLYQPVALSSNSVRNEPGWQRFRLIEPVDAKVVRLVCLNNQISRFMGDEGSEPLLPTVVSPFDQVGFFSIRFE